MTNPALSADLSTDPRARRGSRSRARGLVAAARAEPVAAGATVVLLGIIFVCVAAPLVAPYSPTALDPVHAFAAPSWRHLFGTDELGRDLLSRVLYGGRTSLEIATGATLLALLLGSLWGALAASSGGWSNEVLMRFADVGMAIPVFLSALVLVAAIHTTTLSLIVILGLLQVPWTARMVGTGVAAELRRDYCVAARSFGSTKARLLAVEILPNIAPTLEVQATLLLAYSLLLEVGLSFVGVGVQPPGSSWGTLLQGGYQNFLASSTYSVFPGAAICLTVLMLNVLADERQTRFHIRLLQR